MNGFKTITMVYYYLTGEGCYCLCKHIGNYYLKSDGKTAKALSGFMTKTMDPILFNSRRRHACNKWVGNYYLKIRW